MPPGTTGDTDDHQLMLHTAQPPVRCPDTATTIKHGVPGTDGRWQPTRAGVLNSWKWTDEQFHFADGWLAFVGRNGSGKSLTASQLVTVLLDGDTSQTALSVSGRAAGTLMSRHTDNRDREDKTGMWWLEYGRRDPRTGDTEYLTTGLWLRSSGQALQRAFFVAPARVGDQLTLQLERTVTDIEGLAEQLDRCDGEMFTDSPRLTSKAASHLRAIGSESGYRTAIRTRLFAPLDALQFDALISVLRTMRSVRTAEKISARDMLDVLTNALPALDQAKLSEIAGAMQRISTLETQLADTVEQSRKLAGTDRVYELYRRAVALSVAAALRSANTEFDNVTRERREAESSRDAAEAAARAADEQSQHAKHDAARLKGEVEGAEAALREHAGAELPAAEQHADALAKAARAAEERAGDDRDEAQLALATATESAELAIGAQNSLISTVHDLSRIGAAVGADSVLGTLVATAESLARPSRLDPGTVDEDISVDEFASTPLAWVQMRRANLAAVSDALTTVQVKNSIAAHAAEAHRVAEQESDHCADLLAELTAQRDARERDVENAIAAWARGTEFHPPVPDEIFSPDPATNRLNLTRLPRWLEARAGEIRKHLDVPGRQAHSIDAARTAAQATEGAEDRRRAATDAAGAAAEAQDRRDEHGQIDAAATREEDRESDDAVREHDHRIDTAALHVHRALSDQVGQTETAVRALADWNGQLREWQAELRWLAPDLDVPSDPHEPRIQALLTELVSARDRAGDHRLDHTTPVVEICGPALATLTDFDDRPIHDAAARAAKATAQRWERAIAAAEREVAEQQRRVDQVNAALAEARRAPSSPPAPSWRTRTDGYPLWSLVDFGADVDNDLRDRCEGALLVSGILDAIVTPDGRARAGDTVLTGTAPTAGPSLADVLIIEPDSPVDAALTMSVLRGITLEDTGTTVVRCGVLTAAAPASYTHRYIGTTTRERRRIARVAELESQLQQCLTGHATAVAAERECRAALAAADAEHAALPSAQRWQRAREDARAAREAAARAEQEAARRRAAAADQLQAFRNSVAEARRARAAALAELDAELATARALADQAERAAAEATATAEDATATAERARTQFEEAGAAQSRAEAEARAFPSLTAVTEAQLAEDDATRDHETARAQVVRLGEQLRGVRREARNATSALDQTVDLGGGRRLPSETGPLKSYSDTLDELSEQISSWRRGAERADDLGRRARVAARTATARDERWRAQQRVAEVARAEATTRASEVAQMRALHGADYERRRQALTRSSQAYESASRKVEQLREEIQAARIAEASALSTLEGITPRREQAELRRERCLRDMIRLVEENVAAVDADVALDDRGRPVGLTAALAWGAHLLAAEPRSAHRDELAKLMEARRVRLETDAKKTSGELARFDRQVTLQTIPGTDWRRAVVAAPDAIVGEDLHETLTTLRHTAEQLDRDLRDDVKQTLKTSMFTALRREIATRRAGAQELVRQIRATLGDVRTGVARVGVEVDWKVRRDPDAQKMIELISALPSDETFQQMYEVLRQRLEEATGDTWEARVAHTFDYRVWHEWDIKVTHASFGDGKTEMFRPLTARSNPLASFSTGEMRLATMLPLLAAAWSMYQTPDYRGPRLLFVDEMNAAFDPENVRKLLGLLREWDFDVLSTAPEMSAVLKSEAGRAMIAQITQSGDMRLTIPWLWNGSGQPTLAADRLGSSS